MNTQETQSDRDDVTRSESARVSHQAPQKHDGHSNVSTAAKPHGSRVALPLTLACIAAALLTVGIIPRLHASTALTEQLAAQRALPVSIVQPKEAPASQELLLPGSVMPFIDAPIYARTSGYIVHWNTDIGAKVKTGDVLAVIQTPELDSQLTQARADEATALANYNYARSTSDRWQQMLKTQSVAQQDADTKMSDMQAKKAMLDASRANVQRLSELVSFEKVTAPFDGVITARNIDIGSLVTAGGAPGVSSPTSSDGIFHMEQTTTLRVFVQVPQDDAAGISPGTPVYLTSQQYPNRRFPAKVARTANAIDPTSRTLRVEIDVDNTDGTLMPGAYAQAHLSLVSAHPSIELPVSALLFRPNGVTVVVVGNDGKAHLKTVTIGRDFGTFVEIGTGIATTDRVVDNPGDSISEGEVVQVITPAGSHA
jgi:RND family efflux transporter MFP subunit